MDSHGDSGSNTTRRTSRKRSNMNHRPSNESESPQENRDSISLSSTPSDHVSDAPSVGKESSTSLLNLCDAETVHKIYDEDNSLEESTDLKSCVDDNPAAASLNSRQLKDNKMSEQATGDYHSEPLGAASDGTGTGNKVNKVKLKVGGVTHTIHTRSSSRSSSVAGTFATKPSTDANYPVPKENLNLHDRNEKGDLRGVPWKDFSRTGFAFGKLDSCRDDIPEESVKQAVKHDRPSKNKSKSKKHSDDEIYEEDAEIRYLQKLKTSRITSYDNTEYEDGTFRGRKLRKISRVMDRDIEDSALAIGDYGSSRSAKERKKSRYARAPEDTEYAEEEESLSDAEVEHKNKKQRKLPTDVANNSKESSITTRRRATLSGREPSPGLGAKSIQFPDGLPPAPPRKTKEQLSEVEQQLKRAEAAQRRRVQNEKASRESEAEAIRKILGQDSSRKRREDKIKKQQQELVQERNANGATVAPDAVRWVMGPSGTVVTFPAEVGLPSIFEPKSCSYPPPREKCAGPSCTNVYKYRDSKSKLPLCSLQCYKALLENAQPLHAR
ncbi:stress response protein NST1-like isoform X1 [Salvia divinorum]|uniref:Stress response protein NST1-like isoform X1 n=1 Tax=Salvia divinorum TaxID=28513 RepID=A0ABD1I7S6_SALDI